MDEFPVLGPDTDREQRELMASIDAPAYIRRARRVQQAYDDLVAHCRRQRDEWLAIVRIRLGQLFALAGDWSVLRPHVHEGAELEELRRLHEELKPKLRATVTPTMAAAPLKRAMRQLVGSMERFNQRWQRYLLKIDLGDINDLREGYNRHYVFEKECAIRSAAVARQGFRPLEPLTLADLTAALPLLPMPTVTYR
jgi:hypothetical protein